MIKREQELYEAHRDAILSAEAEKKALKELAQDGIQAESEAMKELIDTYKDSLDAAKDLYDFQKRLADQTKNVSELQKQLSAYENDNSEETKATVQRLKVDLENALQELDETEYDHYVSDQKKLLDDFYDEYEKQMDERFDEVNFNLSEMIDTINANSTDIYTTLKESTEAVGYTMTDEMNNVWNLQKSAMDGNTNSIVSVLTTYSANFSSAATSVNSALAGIRSSVDAIIAQANAKAAASVQKVQTQTSAVTTAATKAASTAVANTKTQAKVATTTKKPVVITTTKKPTTTTKKLISLEEWLRMDANAKYRYLQGLSDSDQQRFVSELRQRRNSSTTMFGGILGNIGLTANDRLTSQQATGAANEAEAIIQRIKLLASGAIKYAPATSGIMSFLGFASGTKRVGANTLAWTNEHWDKNGGETILRASDHAVLQPVGANDRIYNAMATSNLWDMANNPSAFIARNISPNIGSPLGGSSSGGNSVNLENVNFNFPSVKNYTEFVTALQNDKKFESMIQNMTLGAMMGRNNKNSILWNH